MPFVRRTRATLRSAEFGFFGVVVYTRTQTPRRCGQALSAGEAVFHRCALRPNFTSWLIVGIRSEPLFKTATPGHTPASEGLDYRERRSNVNAELLDWSLWRRRRAAAGAGRARHGVQRLR